MTVRGCRLALTVVLIGALTQAACGERPPEDITGGRSVLDRQTPLVPEAERYGGTLVVAGRGDAESMNSLVSTSFESAQHQIYVLFVTLVRSDAAYRPEPYLARNWEFDSDTSQVVFRLRGDLRWHDGAPVTAEDVVFTFRRLKDPRVPFPNPSYFDYWDAAEAVDDTTVRFFIRPHANALYGWSRTAIMPAHLLEAVPPGELPGHPFGTLRPVGSGPFRFVERVPGERWVFEANPDFPAELGGRPYLDRLVYRQISDEFALTAALRAAEVDLILEASPQMLEQVAGDTSIFTQKYPAPEYAFIAWNSLRPWFRDPWVRRALTMAIDREALVGAVLDGNGTVSTGPVGPWHWAYDSSWMPLPYAPDSAAALLEAAGWRDADGDGVREKDGLPFSFDLVATPRRDWQTIQTLVQAWLARVGVEARPTIRERAALVPLVTAPDRRFDALLVGWARDVPLNDRDLWACDQVGQPVQFTSYCNPKLDPVLDSIPVTADRDHLRSLIRRYHDLVSADQPYTFLYDVDRVDAMRWRLFGTDMDSRGDWVNVTRWWVHRGGSPGR